MLTLDSIVEEMKQDEREKILRKMAEYLIAAEAVIDSARIKIADAQETVEELVDASEDEDLSVHSISKVLSRARERGIRPLSDFQ